MRLSNLALLPILAGGFVLGRYVPNADELSRQVSLDGIAKLTRQQSTHQVFHVPKGQHFVLTDLEVVPIEGPSRRATLYERRHGEMPRIVMAGDFLMHARLFEQLGPRTDLVFGPGSKVLLGADRTFAGASCFAYHARGRLVPQ